MEDGRKGKGDVEHREKGKGEKKQTGWVGDRRRGTGRDGAEWEREGSRGRGQEGVLSKSGSMRPFNNQEPGRLRPADV